MGILSNIFKSRPKLEPLDFSIIGTDMHSHLIPGIDDGSKSIEESLALLKKFTELGYKKVITTPHVMSDFYKNTPDTILKGLSDIIKAKEQAGIPIEIEAAAEYYLDTHFNELIDEKKLLTFGENHVLFELSFSNEPPGVKEAIFQLVTNGYQPIMAHVERYPFYFNNFEKIQDFKRRECLIQLNINSLSGNYGPQVKKMAEKMIDLELVDVIGSDCHHMGHLEMLKSLERNPYLHKIANKEALLNKTF